MPVLVLVSFLCLIFVAGGSSWGYEQKLVLLRPAAVIAAGIGLCTIKAHHLRCYYLVWAPFLAVTALTIIHLIPLPYAWWSLLPGREVIVDIGALAGLGHLSRPITLSPDATLNALWSLTVPFAVLVLASQIDELGHRRLLVVLLALVTCSGLIGLLQVAGSDIALYADRTSTSGFFANRNHQAILLAMIFPMAVTAMAVGFGLGIDSRIEKFIGYGIAILAIPLIIITGSRAGLMAGLAAVLAIPYITKGYASANLGYFQRIIRVSTAMAVFIGIVLGTIFASRDLAISRVISTDNDIRWPVWRSVFDALPEFWPWGSGVGSYVEAYQIIEPDTLLRPTFSNHAHNEWLEIALTAGAPGIFLLIVSGLLCVLAFVKGFSKAGRPAMFSRLGISLILVLVFASTVDYPVRTPIHSSILAMAAIWAASWRGFHRSDSGARI